MPKNCNECEQNKSCQSHFGGIGCVHKKEIEEQGRKMSKLADGFSCPKSQKKVK